MFVFNLDVHHSLAHLVLPQFVTAVNDRHDINKRYSSASAKNVMTMGLCSRTEAAKHSPLLGSNSFSSFLCCLYHKPRSNVSPACLPACHWHLHPSKCGNGYSSIGPFAAYFVTFKVYLRVVPDEIDWLEKICRFHSQPTCKPNSQILELGLWLSQQGSAGVVGTFWIWCTAYVWSSVMNQ